MGGNVATGLAQPGAPTTRLAVGAAVAAGTGDRVGTVAVSRDHDRADELALWTGHAMVLPLLLGLAAGACPGSRAGVTPPLGRAGSVGAGQGSPDADDQDRGDAADDEEGLEQGGSPPSPRGGLERGRGAGRAQPHDPV